MHRIVLIFLAVCSPLSAKLPELDAIFWGQVRHKTNQPLVTGSSGNIVIVAKLNGLTVAQKSLPAGSSQFMLKVPMDDGLSPRLPGTARAGERVRIYVRSNSLAVEQEAAESASAGGFALSSTKGDIVSQVLSVSADLSDSMTGAMPAWLVGFGLPADSANLDTDADGTPNGAEYAADTNPTDHSQVFRIIEVTKSAGNNFIKFGPIRPTRHYTIWCSQSLGSGSWSSIGQVTPGTSGDWFLFGHPTPNASSVFYRLEVNAP